MEIDGKSGLRTGLDERTTEVDVTRAGGRTTDGAGGTTEHRASACPEAGHRTNGRTCAGADQATRKGAVTLGIATRGKTEACNKKGGHRKNTGHGMHFRFIVVSSGTAGHQHEPVGKSLHE